MTRSELAIAIAVASGWILIASLPVTGLPVPLEEAPGLDAHIYISMAESPSRFTMAPFGYRIGVPLLARLLPLPLDRAFLTLTILGLLLSLVLGYCLFRQLGFSHGLSLLGVSFVGATPTVSVFLRNHYLVDPLSLALVVALLLAIEHRVNEGALALLLLVASLFKENAFFVLPVLYFAMAEEHWWDRRAFSRVLMVSLPAVLAALYLRFGWDSVDGRFPYLSPWSLREGLVGSMDSYRAIWSGLFGYLAIVAAANAFDENGRGFARRYGVYMALVMAQLIIPRNSERLLFYGFPFIVPLALEEFRRIRTRIPSWFSLLSTLLAFSYLFAPSSVVAPLAVVVFGRFLIERRESR